VGMSPPAPGNRGLGLRIMNYRAQKIGGRLETGPSPAGGLEVRCRFPWDEVRS
jgi:signal transduction histidine kinase